MRNDGMLHQRRGAPSTCDTRSLVPRFCTSRRSNRQEGDRLASVQVELAVHASPSFPPIEVSERCCRCASVVRRRTEDPACCRHLQQHCPLLGWRLLTLTPPELPLFVDRVRRILGLGSRLLGAALSAAFPATGSASSCSSGDRRSSKSWRSLESPSGPRRNRPRWLQT